MRTNSTDINGRNLFIQRWVPTPGTVLFTLLSFVIYVTITSVNSARASLQPQMLSGTGTTVMYSGYLQDTSGHPSDGSIAMSFAIYDSPAAGQLLWGPEQHAGVPVDDGRFSAEIGTIDAGGIPGSIRSSQTYVEIVIDGEELTLRERIPAVTSGSRSWYIQNSGNDYRTQSTEFSTVPEMSLSIETNGSPVHITYDAGFSILNSNAPSRFVAFAIYVDGEEKNRHVQRVFSSGQGTNAQIHWVGELQPGEHLVEIKWRVNQDDVVGRTAFNAWERNFLVVTELGQ